MLPCAVGIVLLLAQSPKPAFEVASIKPSAQENDPMKARLRARIRVMTLPQPGTIHLEDPGRLRMLHWPLRDIIASAYRVRADQVSGPSWMEDAPFDIEAKIPEGQSAQVNEMLQALLEERFDLRLHRETATQSGYALVIGKNGPKLNPAAPPPDPTVPVDQDALKRQAQEGLKKLTEGGPHKGSFRRSRGPMTMQELSNRLTLETNSPVVDETGLTGRFDVVLETSAGNPDEPDVTIFDAVAKLGLKLESRKVTVEKVVVDQVLKIPLPN